MLYISTDLKNKNWLIYILGEFKRINKANFDIKVIDSNDIFSERNKERIYYTKTFIQRPTVINESSVLPKGAVTWISDRLFVIDGTSVDDERYACKYDLLWNAFVFLSRFEEYLCEDKGRTTDSYAFKHPRIDKRTFDIPIVNSLFNELEELIKKNFPNLTFGEKERPKIELSHDVDYIEKTLRARFKQTAHNAYNTLMSIYRPVRFLKGASSTIGFLFSNPSYWCFDYWERVEKDLEKRSTFYVYIKTDKKRFKSWILDPSYDVYKDEKLQQTLKHLIAEGFEIGLHGSFNSAVCEESLAKEKEILENSINCEITKVRQHWLRYEERVTPYIHNRLFQYDSTLGWNDKMGFRSGCASRYRPYDHANQKAFDFFETPQIIMDANMFNYSGNNPGIVVKKAVSILEMLDNYSNTHVSICWHQRTHSIDYGWSGTYERLINTI